MLQLYKLSRAVVTGADLTSRSRIVSKQQLARRPRTAAVVVEVEELASVRVASCSLTAARAQSLEVLMVANSNVSETILDQKEEVVKAADAIRRSNGRLAIDEHEDAPASPPCL